MDKYIIAWDTICQGWQCEVDEDEKPAPQEYETHAEAMLDLFTDALAMIEDKTEAELAEVGIKPSERKKMQEILKGGDAKIMEDFLWNHPDCNYNDEFIIPKKDFLLGRKIIFTGNGLQVIGAEI